MSWWEVVAVFVGIPTAVVVAISVLVMWTVEGRVPDGIAAASREREAQDPQPGEADEPGDEGRPQ